MSSKYTYKNVHSSSRRERVCLQFTVFSSSNSLQINILIKLDKSAEATYAHLTMYSTSTKLSDQMPSCPYMGKTLPCLRVPESLAADNFHFYTYLISPLPSSGPKLLMLLKTSLVEKVKSATLFCTCWSWFDLDLTLIEMTQVHV